jgi:pimeloyl-ACP methyl ester carboxylesterase
LLLLHGGGGTWRLWEPVLPWLEPHHDVVAPTLAGHWGGPALPAGESMTIGVLAGAVEDYLDAEGLDAVHVAGGSLGGWLALELARRGRAKTVVAIAPAGGWRQGGLDWLALEWMYRALRSGARVLARRPCAFVRRPRLRCSLFWHHFAHPERLHPSYCADVILALAHCDGLDAFLAWSRAYGGARDLHEIRCPVLLVFPERDLVLPRRRYGERIVGAIHDAEVVTLPDVGHIAMADDPALVAQTIIHFIRRHRG